MRHSGSARQSHGSHQAEGSKQPEGGHQAEGRHRAEGRHQLVGGRSHSSSVRVSRGGRQSIVAKRAEAQRAFLGMQVIEDPHVRAELLARASTARSDLAQLAARGVSLTPFLEIGAGSAQRSIALMSRHDGDGVALDISEGSLRNAPYVLALLRLDGGRDEGPSPDAHRAQRESLPLLVCADAHHIPFQPKTFRFVFAYRALHHFSDPRPVLAECARVLVGGGHLFFDEEPMDSRLRRMLRGDRTLSDPPSGAQKLARRMGLDKVFWDDGAPERALGMTEARFDAALWRDALAPFEIVDLEVNRKLRLRADLRADLADRGLASRLAEVVGGNVRGLCRKAIEEHRGDEGAAGHARSGDALRREAAVDFRQRLMCVDCRSAKPLRLSADDALCVNCGRRYPVVDGVLRVLPGEIEDELYE